MKTSDLNMGYQDKPSKSHFKLRLYYLNLFVIKDEGPEFSFLPQTPW